MNIYELARMVHDNAVKHGWWDGGERDITEILALIHSEWSEALEEARAGMPMVYKLDGGEIITPQDARYAEIAGKPEGIAVELIDGVIRILDFLSYANAKIENKDESEDTVTLDDLANAVDVLPESVSGVVCMLHLAICVAMERFRDDMATLQFYFAIGIVCKWLKARGVDPMAVLMEKHAYNETRPYKHGKLF